MNILVTGARGQLGLEIQNSGLRNPSDAYFFCGSLDLDIRDEAAAGDFIRKNGIGLVMNCAAYTDVDAAEEDIDLARDVNQHGPRALARAAKDHGAALIHISTDYVFDGKANVPYRPSDPMGATPSIYGQTKRLGECAISASGCRHMVIRTSWLYSKYGKRNFPRTITGLLSSRDSIRVVYDQVGSPTNARDLAEFMIHVAGRGLPEGRNVTCHFTDDGVASWYDVAMAVKEFECNGTCAMVPCLSGEFAAKAPRPHYSVLNNSETKALYPDFKWRYWRDSLRDCISEADWAAKKSNE